MRFADAGTDTRMAINNKEKPEKLHHAPFTSGGHGSPRCNQHAVSKG
jgi:hypothetical protein